MAHHDPITLQYVIEQLTKLQDIYSLLGNEAAELELRSVITRFEEEVNQEVESIGAMLENKFRRN